MDAAYIQNALISDPDKIGIVLEELGFEPRDKGGYYQCKNLDGDNETAIAIYKDTLVYKNYTRNKSGNIFTLIMDIRDCNFYFSLKWVVKKIGLANAPEIKVVYPFGGFYRFLQADNGEGGNPIYAENMLPAADGVSYRFFKDGIDYQTQEYFGVRYDREGDSVLIPIRNFYGQLVGCKARVNNDNDFSHRWYAYLPYQKTKVLYGWTENYKSIVEKGTVVIVESEKGVQQMYSFGCKLGLAVGGHDISATQANYIKLLKCKKVIIAFDEDVEEDWLEKESKKIKTKDNKVFFVKDREHRMFEFGSKDAPCDHGKEFFGELLKHYLVEYKGGETSEV